MDLRKRNNRCFSNNAGLRCTTTTPVHSSLNRNADSQISRDRRVSSWHTSREWCERAHTQRSWLRPGFVAM